jgi:SpoVK/Ycf46/Vps4 family AAA+-type ATPase
MMKKLQDAFKLAKLR